MTPTKESILRKHLSVDHALDSGLHFTRDIIGAAMDEWRTIGEREAAEKAMEWCHENLMVAHVGVDWDDYYKRADEYLNSIK